MHNQLSVNVKTPGARLRYVRRTVLGLSRGEAWNMTGVPEKTLRNYEIDKNRMTLFAIVKICECIPFAPYMHWIMFGSVNTATQVDPITGEHSQAAAEAAMKALEQLDDRSMDSVVATMRSLLPGGR